MLGSEIPVAVTLFVEDGALQGTLDIDSRRIKNLAFTAEVLPDGTIRFVIPDQDPPLTFDGRIEDGAIVGAFKVGIIRGSFALERAAPES